MKKLIMKKIKIISTLALISSLAACVDQEKNKLDNRVLDYWNFKINKDYESAYDFLSPGWKSTENKEAFARRMKNSTIDWKSAKILTKECSETYLCDVSLQIEYEYMFKEAIGNKILMPTSLKENWLMQDNVWYNVPVKKRIKSRN
ncbi:MAG: hypothetical protein AB8B80_08980 [Marinicellaceae bacterium]